MHPAGSTKTSTTCLLVGKTDTLSARRFNDAFSFTNVNLEIFKIIQVAILSVVTVLKLPVDVFENR
jgi:hypothetical protein